MPIGSLVLILVLIQIRSIQLVRIIRLDSAAFRTDNLSLIGLPSNCPSYLKTPNMLAFTATCFLTKVDRHNAPNCVQPSEFLNLLELLLAASELTEQE